MACDMIGFVSERQCRQLLSLARILRGRVQRQFLIVTRWYRQATVGFEIKVFLATYGDGAFENLIRLGESFVNVALSQASFIAQIGLMSDGIVDGEYSRQEQFVLDLNQMRSSIRCMFIFTQHNTNDGTNTRRDRRDEHFFVVNDITRPIVTVNICMIDE